MQTSPSYRSEFAKRNEHWQIFRSVFEGYHGEISEEYLIPKLIHMIWLGSPFPERCKEMLDSWRKCHPDWTIKLWTDADVEGFHLVNQAAYNRAQNFGEKSDIFRYEILYRYGGLYVDTDFECLKPFDELHRSCEFYAGITHDQTALLCNALIGARPGHPILKECIENIPVSAGNHNAMRIMNATGPYYFSKIYFLTGLFAKTVILPVTYFYPVPGSHRTDTQEKKRQFIRPESMAVHHWASTWTH